MWKAMIPLCLLILLPPILNVEANRAILAKPGCNDTCGHMKIPFPFGIGSGCFHGPWFEIECKPASSSSNGSMLKPFSSKLNLEVLGISMEEDMELVVGMHPMNSCRADEQQHLNLTGSPFWVMYGYNVLVMEGCPGNVVVHNQSKKIMGGCATVCDYDDSNAELQRSDCYGFRCCRTSLISDYTSVTKSYELDFVDVHQSCLVATAIRYTHLNQHLSSSDRTSVVPVVLGWSLNWKVMHGNSPHATCFKISELDGDPYHWHCECKEGYYGNPYFYNGCQVPRECMDCRGTCHGSWDMEGRRTSDEKFYCEKEPIMKRAAILGLSISFGTVVLVIVLYGLYRFVKTIRERRRRAKFFKRNGGLLLQQQLSSKEGVLERTRIFSMAELDKATDHFNQNRVLGQGGQGTVYKGMLPDGSIVAIKKAKLLDESQLEQFINEVVILSQVNHRNVVKLLGCCLETEIPLLVYEFVPNGTLFQHIHDPDEDFAISWEMCLKIAADSAGAIAYLHSSSSVPIYHRDIKSSNILLDEKHKAKVSDFGSSRTIAIDQTHMTTLVQGTMGYLDPEYFQSYQFTEKSDVYSFGVVLLELLTSKKPIYRDADTMEQKNLVTDFMFLAQNSRLSDILDPKILRDAKEDEVMAIVELTKRCISWSGKLRPTMKEVAMTLEMIIKSPTQVSRWYQEQESFPISSDGGFEEYAMNDISDAEFSSSTILAGSGSPPHNDVHPLLDSK